MEFYKSYHVQDETINGLRELKEVSTEYDGNKMDIMINIDGNIKHKTLNKGDMLDILRENKLLNSKNKNLKTRNKKHHNKKNHTIKKRVTKTNKNNKKQTKKERLSDRIRKRNRGKK
jgi:hypothetical protein